MTRFSQNAVAALAAVTIMLGTFIPVVTVPPAQTQAFAAAPLIA